MALSKADWDAIAPHYRAGGRSLKDIGKQFDVSDAAIIKKARKEGWTRDLKGKVNAKADAKVSAAMVSAEVSAQTKVTEAMVIEVESAVQARIRLGHRKDIGRYRGLALTMLDELELHTLEPDQLRELVQVINDEEEGPGAEIVRKSRRERLERALNLGSRIKTLKEAADTLKTLVALEREAYGLSNGDEGGGSDFERLVADLIEDTPA